MRKISLIILILVLNFYNVSAQNWGEVSKSLPAALVADGEQFGYSVAISGDYAVIGDPYAKNTGTVLVLHYNGASWDSIANLNASNGAQDDFFGYSVSISGDVIVVGAYGNDANGKTAGLAYVFVKPVSGWNNMTETAKLTASDAAEYDMFGFSVCISGDDIVVGTQGDDDNGPASGSAYVYVKPSSGWGNMTETAKLKPSDGVAYENFGKSVSISDSVIVVGSHSHPDYLDANGAAYVYEKHISGWVSTTETAKLTASDGAADDQFGYSVSISGNAIVVGAIGDDDNGSASGSAYVFEKSASGWTTMTQTAKLTSSDGIANENFAASVSISDSVILIGSKSDPDSLTVNGAAYVYEKPTDGWATMTETAKLTASDGAADDQFGHSVCISKNNIIVGAIGDNDKGSAYLFEKPGTNWATMTETDKQEACFFLNLVSNNYGTSVSVSGDYAVVGSKGYNNGQGCAYVLHFNETNWKKVAMLTASDGVGGNPGDFFGSSVSISGEHIVVGSPADDDKGTSSGSAYLFEKPATGWKNATQTAKFTASDGKASNRFGCSVCVDGDIVVVGAEGDILSSSIGGSAYLFEKPATGWKNATETAKFKASDRAKSDWFGCSVSISGECFVVGARGINSWKGAAYLFEKSSTGWENATQKAKLTATDDASGYFAYSVSISGDQIVIGAYEDADKGAAYLFEKPATGWVNATQTAKLTASDGAKSDNFGYSVNISGDNVVVGARHDNDKGTSSGSAYLFKKPTTGWVNTKQTAKITASDGVSYDRFGVSVGISDDIIIVGAKDVDDIGKDAGAAYIFEEFITKGTENITGLCSESPVQFSITSDKADSFQWQVSSNSGYTFSELSETSEYSGTKTNTLSVNAKYSMNNYLFRCLVTVNEDSVFGNKALLRFDSEIPVITSTHEDKKLAFGSNCSVVLPDYTGDVTATDNCDDDLTITQSPAAGSSITGSATVTLTATDNMGNPAKVSFDVIVEETEAPVITSVHNDQNLTGDENGEITLPDYTDDVTAIDNCDDDLEVKQSPAAGAIIFGQNNTVNLIVTDDAGNYSSKSFNVSVSASSGTSISDLRQNGISVYPNPVSKTLTVQSDGNTLQWIKVIDLTGQVIIEKSGADLIYELDLSGLNSSFYLLRIQSEKGLIYTKIIKE